MDTVDNTTSQTNRKSRRNITSQTNQKRRRNTTSQINRKSRRIDYYSAPDKHIIVSLLKYQMHDLYYNNQIALNTIDPTFNDRFSIFNLVRNHLISIANETSDENDEYEEVIHKLKNCFTEKTIQKNESRIVLSDRVLGVGSWGSVLLLNGFRSYSDEQPVFEIACKLMLHYKFNINELLYFILLKDKMIETYNPHFPLLYSYLYCDNKIVNQQLPHMISSTQTPYFILLSELGDGTLKDHILSDINHEDYLLYIYNAIAQLILAYCFFNKLGHLHKDSNNPANFLYRNVSNYTQKYFKYQIIINKKVTTLYVENMGYLWTLNDFGTSIPYYITDGIIPTEDIKSMLDGIIFWAQLKYNGYDKFTALNAFIEGVKNKINESNNVLAEFMTLIMNNPLLYDTIESQSCVNSQPYIINFDNVEFASLPITGYIDYKT